MDAGFSSFSAVVSSSIRVSDQDLAGRWLSRLQHLLPVDPQSIFPTPELLDHIPALIAEIAAFLAIPEDDVAANTFVTIKARELGVLRHQQGASAHQLLREYELLRSILHTFVLEEMERLSLAPSVPEVVQLMRRIDHAIGVLTSVTVDTFIQSYGEQIDEQTNRLERFNRMVSHELRQPLGVLQMAVRVLRLAHTASDHDRCEKALVTIERNLTKATELVQTITRVSQTRHENRPTDPGTQVVNLSAIAADVARQMREMADARDVEIRVSPNLPTVTLDVGQIELILTNLLSNAVKYSDPAKPARLVEIVPIEAENGPGFQVKDNGLGMSPDQLKEVFTPFYRANSEASSEGIGLGLAIVRDCAAAIGASVTADAVLGQGSVFTVALATRSAAS
jgi:signal transduction histidine kinase